MKHIVSNLLILAGLGFLFFSAFVVSVLESSFGISTNVASVSVNDTPTNIATYLTIGFGLIVMGLGARRFD